MPEKAPSVTLHRHPHSMTNSGGVAVVGVVFIYSMVQFILKSFQITFGLQPNHQPKPWLARETLETLRTQPGQTQRY